MSLLQFCDITRKKEKKKEPSEVHFGCRQLEYFPNAKVHFVTM